MPKYKPKTAELKARKLAKTCLKNNLNNAKTARQLGVTKQAIQQQVNQPAVQDALQEYLDSVELDNEMVEVARAGLRAKKPIGATILIDKDGEVIKAEDVGAIEVPDHNAIHKFWHDLVQIKGKLKPINVGNTYDTKIIQLIVKNDKNKPLLKRIKGK